MRLFSTLAVLAVGLATPVHAAEPPGWPAFRAMFQEMVETDTSYATGDCTVAVNKTAARMKAAGFPAEHLHIFVPENSPKSGNLVAVLPGKDPKARAVLLLGHIDVVNAHRADWTRDPYVLVEENGEFYGRGVSDMKAQDAIFADSMVRYHAEGLKPRRTIKMALTCGEEPSGFVNGASWLAQNKRELIDADFAITEGGGGDLDDRGRKLAVTVMAAEKATTNLTFEVTGPGGHSSKPRPENPIVILGEALVKLGALPFPTEFNAFSRAYFEAVAPRVDAETGSAMRKVLADPQDLAANALVDRSMSRRAMLRTTCIPTLIEGGHASNAQPQRVRATVNCRLLPGQSIAAVRSAIVEAIADPRVTVSAPPPPAAARPPISPLTPQIMDPIRAVAAKVFPGVPVTPMQETFGTDSTRLIAAGIPTFGFSALFRGDDAGNIHGLNEHISVQSVSQGREFLYRLIKAYAEQK
ncbi:M20/M25/M40 family metallo-hydrolase [Phenylobacterium sp.]|uniref:M20/M25/M40 family metallo-hydrolase n=1 Tax=Phenylobacterium sp. TaxID=1871053 RepID=UPI002ED7F9B1